MIQQALEFISSNNQTKEACKYSLEQAMSAILMAVCSTNLPQQ
jgi:hypothetical protein